MQADKISNQDPAPEGPASQRPKATGRSRARWEAILRTAALRFYEDGYEATTVGDVARGANINKGSLYYYIDSKEELLLGVIRLTHEHGPVAIATAREFEGTALERLTLFLTEHTRHQARDAVAAAVFDRESRHLSHDALRPILEQRKEYEAYLEELLVAVDAENPVRFWGDTHTTAISVLAMTNSLHGWFKPAGPIAPDDIADYTVQFVLTGLGLPSSDKPDPTPKKHSRPAAQRTKKNGT
jgi:AcrR family transcriptional regulator